MNDINRLGVRFVGLTVMVLLLLLALFYGSRWGWDKLRDGSSEVDQTAELQRDSDGDGVADLYEIRYYNTDPQSPDTDGDGTSDLDEILTGRNPLTVSVDDELKPPTGRQVVEADTLTKQYLATLPTDVSRSDILNQAKLTAFVDVNKGPLLPAIDPASIVVGPGQGSVVISDYLDATSSLHDNGIVAVTSADLEAAFRLQVNSQNAAPMADLIESLDTNLSILQEMSVPAEVVDLHTRLVAASQALRDSAIMLQNIGDDFVGGLIGAQKLEELGAVFQGIAADILVLEEKYGIE